MAYLEAKKGMLMVKSIVQNDTKDRGMAILDYVDWVERGIIKMESMIMAFYSEQPGGQCVESSRIFWAEATVYSLEPGTLNNGRSSFSYREPNESELAEFVLNLSDEHKLELRKGLKWKTVNLDGGHRKRMLDLLDHGVRIDWGRY